MIVLPWPPSVLSPNARVHWRPKATATKIAKDEAFVLTKKARVRVAPGLVPMRITFHAPDRRRRDDDNAIGSFKAYRDGIALALGVDDSVFRPSYHFGEPTKGGAVVVEIVEDQDARSIGEIIRPIIADLARRVEDAA